MSEVWTHLIRPLSGYTAATPPPHTRVVDVSDLCKSCGVSWRDHPSVAFTCRSLSEAAEERDEYKARLHTATETIKRLEGEIAEWRLASGVDGPLFLKHETAGNHLCGNRRS